MALNRRLALLASASILGSALIGFDPAIMRDLTVGAGESRIVVGAVRVPLWNAAFAQAAGSLTLENVTFAIGPGTYRAKRIDFAGVTSTRAEIDALLAQGGTETLATRIGRINATQVTIPELTSEQKIGDVTQRTTYRNVVSSDIRQGRIAQLTVESARTETKGQKQNGTLAQGRMTAADIDATEIARVYTEKAGPQPAAMSKLYGSFVVEGMTLTDAEGVEIKIARASGKDVRGRSTEDSWAGTASLVTALADMDKPSEQDTARLLSSIADLAGAVDLGSAEMTEIEFAGKSKDFTGTARIARIGYTGTLDGKPADARLEGLTIAGKDTKASIGTISITGFSWQSALAEMKSFKGKRFEDLDAETMRKFIPTIGTVRLADVDFDVPNQEAKSGGPAKIRFTLKDLEVTADKPLNGIPTHLRVAMQNFAMPIPADGKDASLKPLLDLGYKTLNLSFTTEADWNESGNELVVREITYNGQDMGRTSVRAVLGNVTKDVFNPDTAVATVALVGAVAKSAELTLENFGLAERYLAQEARKQKKTPEALRREYGAAAALIVPTMLGNSPQAKEVGQAIARFIAKPGRLTISAKPKSPSGLSLMDVMGDTEPAAIFGKLDVTAKAEDRP